MEKQQIIEKLKELGIISTNVFPKKSFLYEGLPVIGCYIRELKDDFYFFNSFDGTIYKIAQRISFENDWSYEKQTEKWLIPEKYWEKIWKDEPYVELVDSRYAEMTLRHYACIHLKVPESGLVWLDELIKKSKNT